MALSSIRLVLVAASAALLCSQAAAQDWSLFGRHGECAPISSLKRKLQDMPEVRTPEEFAAYLDLKRLKFTRQAHQAVGGGAVEFQVPDAGLAVLFVPRQLCGKGLPAPR
jgi:hypothetical protein